MRLSKEEIEFFKNEISKLSKDAKVYLFGSRVDESKRGGDIDLLIVSRKLTKKDLRRVRVEFFKRFGEQKLDIILDDGNLKEPFVKIILEKAVLL
jgi:predicted nucleotidyltransferase